jgi:hypothetical protein
MITELAAESFYEELDKIAGWKDYLPAFLRPAKQTASEAAEAVAKQVRGEVSPETRARTRAAKIQLRQLKQESRRKSVQGALEQSRSLDEDPRVVALRKKMMPKTAASRLRRGFRLVSYEPRGGSQTHHFYLGGKRIGKATTSELAAAVNPSDVGVPKVREMEIDPKYRGLGLGRKAYGELMRRTPEGTLLSDYDVSRPARRVWERLKATPGYDIEGPRPLGSTVYRGKITPKALIKEKTASSTEAQLMQALSAEGGAAGMKALRKRVKEGDLQQALKALIASGKVRRHPDGDLIKESAATATKTDPAKWEAAKREAKAKMGGKHSARAMQLATQIYKKKGGGYSGPKPDAKSNSLKKWTKQKWKWSGGDKPGQGGKGVYLPSKKVERLKGSEEGRKKLERASAAKSKATSEGRQYSSHGLAAGTSLQKKAYAAKQLAQTSQNLLTSSQRSLREAAKSERTRRMTEATHEATRAKTQAKARTKAQTAMMGKEAEVEYRGITFPGYNKPIASNRKGKKKMVLVKRGDKIRLVHFGQKGYEDFTQHKDKKRRENYLKRSGGIRGKGGKLTANDPFSANYWARRALWPSK